jgi:hypothetical protein
MNPVTREERQWFLRCLAFGLYEYMGAVAPPIPVEGLLKHPPGLYQDDFGVVDMFSTLWDATFARPLNRPGSIFVRYDLPPDERRLALARELLNALITSRHGRALGLVEFLMTDLKDSADYFARHLLAPEPLFEAYRRLGGTEEGVAGAFGIPEASARLRWKESQSLH